mmetsp:Transcript_1487/g.3324  ORF Transcript_1487/g.3324 Transcript_1487/m.3324 type:complete len:97 (-) Transcript_1487:249-539(-)
MGQRWGRQPGQWQQGQRRHEKQQLVARVAPLPEEVPQRCQQDRQGQGRGRQLGKVVTLNRSHHSMMMMTMTTTTTTMMMMKMSSPEQRNAVENTAG